MLWQLEFVTSTRCIIIIIIIIITVEPPCATASHKWPPPTSDRLPQVTTSHKWPPIQNTKTFPMKALQLEPLENDCDHS